MADDSTLLKLAETCLINHSTYAGAQNDVLTDSTLESASSYMHGLTDIYTIVSKYREYKDVTFRIITDEQNKMLAKKWLSNGKKEIRPEGSIFIAMRLESDETPAELAEKGDYKRMVLGEM